MSGTLTDGVLLVARLFLAPLFLVFGWRKLRDYAGTKAQMVRDGVATPVLATVVAILMELPVAFAVAVGVFTRPAAALFVLYTLGTSLIEHRFWTMKGAEQVEMMEAFLKNLSIMGGFLLLCVAGPGKYSIDALCGFATSWPGLIR